MARPPVVVGLTVCRDVVIEQPSWNYSLIRAFTGMPIATFPGVGEPFCVFAALTDGHGQTDVELVVSWFGDEQIVEYARLRGQVRFPDPLQLVECVFRLPHFPFPGPGVYVFTLFLAGEWAAH